MREALHTSAFVPMTPDAASGAAKPAFSRRSGVWERCEGATWLVIVAVYGGWLAILAAAATWMPLWLALPMLAVIVTWHGHLQHEILHGHPTRSGLFNAVLGWPPLGLFYPYSVFKRNHLAHHDVEVLSQPGQDPESFYVLPEDWNRYGLLSRFLLTANNAMLGRFLLGPLLSLPVFFRAQAGRLAAGERLAWCEWALHIGLVAALLYGVETYAGIDSWLYLAAVAYPGHGLLMLRSYLEHRPSAVADERVAVVEGNWFFSLLYLCNNFHFVHHEFPAMAWYEIPRYYADNREEILRRNGGYVFRNYGEVARRFLFRPKDSPEYSF